MKKIFSIIFIITFFCFSQSDRNETEVTNLSHKIRVITREIAVVGVANTLVTNINPASHIFPFWVAKYNYLNTDDIANNNQNTLETSDKEQKKIHSDVSHSFNIQNSSLKYKLHKSGNIKLQIYNIKGILLTTLLDEYRQAGSHYINLNSNKYRSGIYYLKLSIGKKTIVKKAVIIK